MTLALLYYLIVLGAYFAPAHGDRPRWREAAIHVAHARPATADYGPIHAQVPGVIAFYLGVPASETMGHPLVKAWSAASLSRDEPAGWFIAEERLVTSQEQAQVARHCAVSGRFPASMFLRDRTVVVYHCRQLPTSKAQLPNAFGNWEVGIGSWPGFQYPASGRNDLRSLGSERDKRIHFRSAPSRTQAGERASQQTRDGHY